MPPLPRISIPKFSGEFTEWETFRDHFRSVVIDNADLSEVARMHYLLSSLKGEASDIVKRLPTSVLKSRGKFCQSVTIIIGGSFTNISMY